MSNYAVTCGRVVLTAACLGLAARAFQLDYPVVAEAVLAVSGDKVGVERLYCHADGSVIAAGYTDLLTNLEGVAFFSGQNTIIYAPDELREPLQKMPRIQLIRTLAAWRPASQTLRSHRWAAVD